MSKQVLWAAALLVVVWGVYTTWVTGYRAGYDDATTEAWDNARKAFMPRESHRPRIAVVGLEDQPVRTAVAE